MQIAPNKVVSMHYTLTDENGETIDSSAGQEPLLFLSGAQNIIEGLDSALQGKVAGDSLKVEVQPEEGYGPIHQELIQLVPRDNFSGVEEIEIGMQFMAQTPGGQQPVTVIAIEEDGIMLDGNHPLAGKVLNFDVEIIEVREASEEELEHSHAHGEGGHEH
ncbi:FKBP-type peptidyl-prolyl cis-trans isomerase [Marinomonas mediterranea]|jgi:FKBP-type peptidyl-prolyl cis-trans isomerases 2|uniref:Peptidyl-prolyl cis-trans isomerase n=1 Tax=Marinomonas mediterranea (strain ATCC 700492 / JCM 21426 / NBRC 103028 / MMB-1) TaxID=717774 RepID=F2K2X5_MARM1|nr:peptidylprolyl isomerase [Marinomonas mediterranea]ADZ92364.1 Peptidylprolyl isomerase [Marinomonas mediterranea MMB-1]WCN10316.1 peptidylprolyl isomerase [Marinomonas mediterranea]WCN14361.1 peptidylprolyl isomerase [Marinomonas mediterranea]WCN18413.1 peptidylprolyl isomerase [Marinomonas mediterranea MMB-1]